ncbi:unnamed protein product, partial [Ceratitis capitata]
TAQVERSRQQAAGKETAKYSLKQDERDCMSMSVATLKTSRLHCRTATVSATGMMATLGHNRSYNEEHMTTLEQLQLKLMKMKMKMKMKTLPYYAHLKATKNLYHEHSKTALQQAVEHVEIMSRPRQT